MSEGCGCRRCWINEQTGHAAAAADLLLLQGSNMQLLLSQFLSFAFCPSLDCADLKKKNFKEKYCTIARCTSGMFYFLKESVSSFKVRWISLPRKSLRTLGLSRDSPQKSCRHRSPPTRTRSPPWTSPAGHRWHLRQHRLPP